VLGLDVDPGPLQLRAEAERALRPTALALRGMRPPRFAGLFEAFANVVPFQQLSLDAGVAIVGRLVERFGRHVEHAGRRFHAFPEAGAIAEARLEALRRCGLSSRKAAALRSLARAVQSGELTAESLSRMSTSDALKMLAELPGIGPWSASVVLLRGLGRLDVFPPGDVGAQRGLRAVMHLDTRRPLGRIVEGFGDHRGYLYFCALGGGLLAKGLIQPASPSS
jgi:DNA-3-methyladenine glycosylase II